MKLGSRTVALLLIVVVVAVVGVVAVVALLLDPPSVDIAPGFLTVGLREGSCEYDWSFGLVNSGGAGYAKVQLLLGETVAGDADFFVPAYSTVRVNPTWIVYVDDCGTVPSSIRIASVWKA